MANLIQLKRKTTAGAPTVGQLAVGEVCLVIPDEVIYWKKDATTLVGPIGAPGSVLWSSITGTQSNVNLSGFTNDAGFITLAAITWANLGGSQASINVGGFNNDAGYLVISDIAGKADIADPDFTGTPTAPTATGGTNTDQIATTAFVQNAINSLIGGAPGTLDTLNELAAAIADDENFSATITAQIASKLDANSTIDGGTIS